MSTPPAAEAALTLTVGCTSSSRRRLQSPRSCRSRPPPSPACGCSARSGTPASTTTATSISTATAASASRSPPAVAASPTRPSSSCRSRPRHRPEAAETPVRQLPDETIAFTMPSRFCLPYELGHEAWQRFGRSIRAGSACRRSRLVHDPLEWVPGASNPWTTAADAYRAGQGVCRDFAHLAITFCRALNIPARYVFGYIPEIDCPPLIEPMDFAAWFEAYIGGRWHTFDARNNIPRDGPRRRRPRPRRRRRRADHLVRPARPDGLRGPRRGARPGLTSRRRAQQVRCRRP